MAATNADILGWLNANPGASPALVNQTMAEAGVSAAQYQSATGAPPPPVQKAVAPQGMLSGPAPSAPAPSAPAVTNADILGWFNANPNASDALIAQTMQQAGVTPARLAQLTGAPVAEVAASFQAAIAPKTITDLYQQELGRLPESQAVIKEWEKIFGSTIEPSEVAQFQQAAQLEKTAPAVANIKGQILAQGTTDKWTGQGFGSAEANATDMAKMLASAGITDINQFGEIQKTVVDEEGNNVVVKTFGNKVTGQEIVNNYESGSNAFGGTYAGKGNTGYRVDLSTGKPIFYTTGASSNDLFNMLSENPLLNIGANVAAGYFGGPLGVGALQAAQGKDFEDVAKATLLAYAGQQATGYFQNPTTGQITTVPTEGSVPFTGADYNLANGGSFSAAGPPSGVGTFFGEGVTSGIPSWDTAFTGAGGLFNSAFGLPVGNGAFIGEGVPTGIPASDALYTAAGGLLNPAYFAGGAGVASIIGGAGSALPGLPAGIPPALANAGVSTAINKIIGGGGTSNIPNLISGGLGTAGNLLQMQESREAAQRAQARIDAETAAAKASAAFRPIGMTTRFGTSQFQVDPVTGQLTSAGYTLSPEAKAQQDRFMALSNAGLTQAEQAATQFAPLQTGAQRLFGLGNEYLAQSPEQVAQNYLTQQMNLLAPSREIELANLQTKLRNQGRIGLSVAQGGNYGATTPELQALYNARARQEAELAANAELAGQRNVTFGAGLLDQGSRTMGQYYSGQQGSYAPYTTAMGQVQSLEALGQQPFNMSNALAQQTSTAGARVGQLGLQGAGQSVALATGADATRNLGAQSLIAAGNPNAQFGSAIGGALGGLFNTAPATSGFSYGQYGTGIDPSTGEYFGSLYF
tara:strand:- start:135 stop:2729 length:2595 start_codon:yes stop_codon:yes gene_type:complete